MKTILTPIVAGLAGILFIAIINARADDPRTNSWFTTYSGQYARIYTNDLSRTNGKSLTTWTNSGGTAQALPAYCGVQEVYSSTNWIYIRSTGLAGYVMGAWYGNSNHTQPFNQWPTNQHVLFRIPRTNAVPLTKSMSGGGAIGISVDGVAMYNNWDANYWNGSTEVSSTGGSGYWNRDAYVNEGASFDPGNAHQPGFGQYHYHANPPALRYQLGDHVDYNPVTKVYTESTNTATKHSPILGWASDGFPIYGPYGYAVSNNAGSGIKRMVSGFVIRNGQSGTSNLTANGRTTIPAWAARLYNVSSNILAGPGVSSSYPLGRYLEDNDFLGDHGYKQGVDFDLDEYNGRYCVTPEFPGGTYAYFVAISSNGTPVYPYNLGFGYFGNPAGGSVASISENVVTNFLGGPGATPSMSTLSANNGTITLTWTASEGGTYRVESTTNLVNWITNSTTATAALNTGGYTTNSTDPNHFYRVARTALASYDSPGSGGYTPTYYSFSPGGSAARGTTVTVTNTLAVPPPSPMLTAPAPTVMLAGNIPGSGISHPATNIVICTFAIPTNAPIGSTNIVITFGSGTMPPPWTNSFTINP